MLSGDWDEGLLLAVLNWTESAATTLSHDELRMSAGPAYDSGSSSSVDTFPQGTTDTQTAAGLTLSGDIASFKVFVVLTTGNQAGSNTLTITRP